MKVNYFVLDRVLCMMSEDCTESSVVLLACIEVRVDWVKGLDKFVNFLEVGMEQFSGWITVEDNFMVLGLWRRSDGTYVFAKSGGTVEVGEGLFGEEIVWADIFRQNLSCVLVRNN